MKTGILGEIRLWPASEAPDGWMFCDGQELSAKEYPNLSRILGGAFGQGAAYFRLPDFRGAFPRGRGAVAIGERGGAYEVTLTQANLPSHTHSLKVAAQEANSTAPSSGVALGVPVDANGQIVPAFTTAGPAVQLAGASIASVGEGAPVNITPPFLGVAFIICVDGGPPWAK